MSAFLSFYGNNNIETLTRDSKRFFSLHSNNYPLSQKKKWQQWYLIQFSLIGTLVCGLPNSKMFESAKWVMMMMMLLLLLLSLLFSGEQQKKTEKKRKVDLQF